MAVGLDRNALDVSLNGILPQEEVEMTSQPETTRHGPFFLVLSLRSLQVPLGVRTPQVSKCSLSGNDQGLTEGKTKSIAHRVLSTQKSIAFY